MVNLKKFTDFSKLNQLTILELRDNGIQNIPSDISQLQNLIRLDFSNNLLVTIPREIHTLVNLKIFDLKGNNFIDREIQEKSEKSISLLMNYIKQIKEEPPSNHSPVSLSL